MTIVRKTDQCPLSFTNQKGDIVEGSESKIDKSRRLLMFLFGILSSDRCVSLSA